MAALPSWPLNHNDNDDNRHSNDSINKNYGNNRNNKNSNDDNQCGGCSFPKAANEAFAVEATKWVFHERGVLRASNLRHHPPGSSEPSDHYRITDDLEFAVDLHEYRDGAWQPYQ